ncbi:MAG: dTDP-4-dehydrorhamnose reductase [Chlamydiales bacterium]|nr:dTDP-4-dehydrorhamnose reductase [Chlamydiales bacterium]
MYWIVGKYGTLAHGLARCLEEKNKPFIATSSQEVDITKERDILAFVETHPLDCIINAAAYTNVDLAEKESEKAFAINSTGPKLLAKIAHERKMRLIHLSTDYVFNGDTHSSYEETDICSPINVYGMTKLYGENFVQQEHPGACIIRTSWLYGKYGHNFPQKIAQLLRTQEKLSIVDDQFSSPTYVDDLVSAIFSLEHQHGVFHFCNKGHVSRYLWALTIYDFLRQKENVPCKALIPVSSKLFISEAKRPLQTCLSTKKYVQATKQIPMEWGMSFRKYLEEPSC